jgi:Lhr-like helicase
MAAPYSISTTIQTLTGILRQYLESQYHIWDESLVAERRCLLEEEGVIAQQPYLEATPFYQRADGYDAIDIPESVRSLLKTCSGIADTGIYPKPFTHQADALSAYLTHKRNLIVATGTGSGKTESFLMPILGALHIESLERRPAAMQTGCRALLLYPMNALVNDQVARLRRLFGREEVARLLAQSRGRRARFGMYTSRTPYPGQRDAKRDAEILRTRVTNLFKGLSAESRAELEKLGMWPAKDMQRFEHSGFASAPEDRELYSRHEMQAEAPDILVTNYSMLEYMLLRPIEAPIFDQTSKWLWCDAQNSLCIVLDEAHMYRGAGGAEVALLLRRLQSRLDPKPGQVRFILTSASLGSSPEAADRIRNFAHDLTGAPADSFEVIRSHPLVFPKTGPSDSRLTRAFAALNRGALQSPLTSEAERASAETALKPLARLAGVSIPEVHDQATLRAVAFMICQKLPATRSLANLVTTSIVPPESIAETLFTGQTDAEAATDGLIALAAFAYDPSDQRPFLPLRLHLLFRGLGGLYACVNSQCSQRRAKTNVSRLGRLYDTPRLRCDCGARVYELLTHRRCGAAFLRGYWRSEVADFLWHEAPSGGASAEEHLMEVHLAVETDRCHLTDRTLWLHQQTGRLHDRRPSERSEEYLELRCATSTTRGERGPIVSYHNQCPVCLRSWTDETQIMDLQTKGEAPFSYLVREQLRHQPATRAPSTRFPNAGRKVLLFSDGRQKAARLARDIPRDVAKDSFRQLIVLAVRALGAIGRDAVPSARFLYPAFLHVLANFHTQLFDGPAAEEIARRVRMVKEDFDSDLEMTLTDFPDAQPPAQYETLLLGQLGSPFYSLFALTLGYLVPRDRWLKRIREEFPGVDARLVESVVTIWLQNVVERYAIGKHSSQVRATAAGFRIPTWGQSTGIRRRQTNLFKTLLGKSSEEINAILFRHLGMPDPEHEGGYFVDPNYVRIKLAQTQPWYQCNTCTYLAPFDLSGLCPHCGKSDGSFVDPEQSPYLRSRKGLWRDPVIGALSGESIPFSIDVQEHTAQLGHRNDEDIASTTELFERRFRDVLVHGEDWPIDVLSCTTTMEVGIDIGSLVAVGLRNIPPQRQNYQQRAGRAGRRGSSLATVVTYAQNNPHDDFYFRSPQGMISGDPPFPSVDVSNPKLVQRHINAQLLQEFFHSQLVTRKSAIPGIYSTWGETEEFFEGYGEFSLTAFVKWLNGEDGRRELDKIQRWIPSALGLSMVQIRAAGLAALERVRPREELVAPDDQLLEYLFSKAVLPAYAFPRDLLALRIERLDQRRIELEQQPQQGLNVALSEYAPGRFVVVNKETYQIGTVASNGPTSTINRGEPLFARAVCYRQCTNCYHTQEDTSDSAEATCPSCRNGILRVTKIIQPEIAYPRGRQAIDELSDDPIFTDVTAAQLPFPGGGRQLDLRALTANMSVAFGHNENLVVVNRGFASQSAGEGFTICSACGWVQLPGEPAGASHERDYDVRRGGQLLSRRCTGRLEPVFLGYTFPTDLLLLRIQLKSPFNSRYDEIEHRRPLVDAVRSLSEAIAIATARQLQVDTRELKSGSRFLEISGARVTDLYVYDSLAGGAGYSTMAGHMIDEILVETERLLMQCDCTSSCNKCLRLYDNRMFQTTLNRFLALDLLRYALQGTVPGMPSLEIQRRWLEPLEVALSLEGWEIRKGGAVAMSLRRDGSVNSVGCYPSLLDPETLGASRGGFWVSRYDIETRLPNVFARIV